MESCPLPLEVCELIIDAVLFFPDELYERQPECRRIQSALSACSLTCRAWRIRAQQRLWGDIHLFTEEDIALFTSTLHVLPGWCAPDQATLHLSGHPLLYWLDLKTASALFMRPLPGMTTLICNTAVFHLGPRILRMRPPLLSSLGNLELFHCVFESVRALLDVVWACSNLSSLTISGCGVLRDTPPAANMTRLPTICRHLRACERLTSLELITDSPLSNLTSDLVGGAFGSAVSDWSIYFEQFDEVQSLVRFMNGSFPTLSKVQLRVWTTPPETEHDTRLPSMLATLSENLARPEVLKTAVLRAPDFCSARTEHGRDFGCVEHFVRQGHNTASYWEPLRMRLSGLESLTLKLHAECVAQCAAYVDALLPSLRGVLRYEYLDYPSWEEYEVPRGEVEE